MGLRNFFRGIRVRHEESGRLNALDALRFDDSGYDHRGDARPGELRVWHTPDGDPLSLHFILLPPDLPADASSIEQLRERYAELIADSGTQIVEVELRRVDGCPALQTIVKVPQQPAGLTYVGSLIIPFRDFSFVVKVQCEEHGTTGVRETVVLDRWLADGGKPEISGDHFSAPGMNPDDPQHDAAFPEHPLSRARRTLGRLAASIVIHPDIKRLPGFSLPAILD